jgi:branched-chain amino acid transport system ATP-binding protein
MFSVSGLSVTIGRSEILRAVSLSVAPGVTAGLIGRNGAGKTTLMRAVMGLVAPREGAIELGGLRLDRLAPHRRASLGIGYMPEDRRLVPQWTVSDNLLFPLWATGERHHAERLERVTALLPELRSWSPRKALQLSGGQQKIVALGRALMCGTRLLLLDEPFEGVAPALSARLREVIDALKGHGELSVLLAASDYTQAAGLADHLYTIERGSVAESPSPAASA